MPQLRSPALPLPATLLIAAAAAAQNGPPPDVVWWLGHEQRQSLAAEKPWVELLDRSTLSVGRYRLAAGASDDQQPHDRDEVYYVLSGRASFTADGRTREVATGDMVFVTASTEHRFHDIVQDLDLLVLFGAAVPTTGGMAAGPKPDGQTAYPETSPRGATRVFYWHRTDSAGQVAIGYGRPRWQAGFGRFLDRPNGRRWRLGDNFWTTLDTNMRLELGGVEVPIGMYYAVMQSTAERGAELVLLDPQTVRQRRLDAYQANETRGGLVIPLEAAGGAKAFASRLSIELTVDRAQRDRGALTIAFGPHVLRAALVMHPDDGG